MKQYININMCVLALFFFFNGSSGQPMDICTLPKKTGPCRVMAISYYFNEEAKRCESFIYGGCQGNGNSFKTLKECQDTCHGTKSSNSLNPSVKSEHCKLEHHSGPIYCAASFEKYTFNYENLECKRIIYGGCGGTKNLYDSARECMDSCVHGDVGRRQ